MLASESNRIRLEGGRCVSGIRAGDGRFEGNGADSRSADAKLSWRLNSSSSSDEEPQNTKKVQQ